MAKKGLFSKLLSGRRSKLPEIETDKLRQNAGGPNTPVLKLLFFIVDWNLSHFISDVFTEEKVRFHFISRGRGTASSEILNLLGIGSGDKAIITCLEQAVLAPVLMREARRKLGLGIPGAGISFSIPLSAINDPALLVFKQSIHKNEKIGEARTGGEGENMANTGNPITHDLIISIVNHAYSDEVMDTARKAGASGGTVITARGQAHEGAVKFLGISVQDEKEMILILTGREKKIDIMQAICDVHGLNSNAQGIVFSLPVDNVLGLNFE
jgi:nitrogen regulatory protein PII